MYTAKLSLTVPNQKPPMCPSIVEWTNKLYLFNRLLYKNENEWMNATFCSKDKSQEHNVEWKKNEEYILHVLFTLSLKPNKLK